MPTRRSIKGVANNFLGRFTSRYSDWGGYWLFGFLIESLDAGGVELNLLDPSPESSDFLPLTFARKLASENFAEQIMKASLPVFWISEAYLQISKVSDQRSWVINGHSALGYIVEFKAIVITDLGRTYGSSASIFIAPHNPSFELRRGLSIEN